MQSEICTHVGRKIAQIRREKGWSQQFLADYAHLSREHIVRIENGQKEMGLRTLASIATALGVKPADLLA